jgi:two-component system sensor histidine kinase GlrK
MTVRLNLFSRLFLGYFFLLVLASGMSVYSILQLGKVMDVTNSIIMVDNSLISFHKDMTDALLSETRYEKKYLIVRDLALYRGFLKSRAEFEHSLGQARALGADTPVRDALDKAEDHHLIYWSLFQEEADHLKAGRPYDRVWYDKEKERAANAAIQELIKVRLLSQESIYDKVKDLSEAGKRARTIAMSVSAAMLLFGILLAVWITRSITRPLTVMQKKTRDIADGVFEADLKLPSPPEIGELAQAFNTMCSKLKEVDRMKSDFFSLMSHELRTPLTSIKEGTNLFLEGCCGEVTEKQKKLLTIIAEESNRLIGLVNSVLDLSKLESGMLAFNFGKANLSPLIERVVKEVGPLAEAKHIRITREVGDLPPLNMDTERMLQVLRNLIGNALKFTPRGGSVSITAGRGEKAVIVSVGDTGPGIPREHTNAIFDKFRQIPGTGRLPGTGLGLAIVKHIIQAHGGSVWVESEAGSGSTFIFQLPA